MSSSHRRAARPFSRTCLFLALSTAIATAGAQSLAPHDALSDGARVRAARAVAQTDLTKLKVHGHRDERLGLPSFLWVSADSPARQVASRGADPVTAARAQLRSLASLYRLSDAEINELQVLDQQQLPSGASLVRLRQYADGIEIFRESIALLSDADGKLAAVSGYVAGTGRSAQPNPQALAQAFRRDERSAIARVLDDHGLSGAELAAPMQLQTQQGPYRYFSPAMPAQTGEALALSAPLRVKPVYFRLPEGLVPAWYVESQVDIGDEARYFAHVVSAKDDAVLFRRNLSADQDYSYRVWAETAGDFRPLPGPQDPGFFPHPTGTPDGSQPVFVPPSLVTLQNVPFSQNDPWLPDAATETNGNNVDAYADVSAPDGLGVGDFRATVTAPGVFDRIYDTSLAPNSSNAQIQAAVTQLFYVNNWLHDEFYDAGFDEAAGNAQQNNFGRGGLGGDSLRAEAQDNSGLNNANMATPADGADPRMQMYVFTGVASSSLDIGAPINQTWAVQAAAFGPTAFDITAPVTLADDQNGAFADACQPLVNNVAGDIVLADRGTCTFTVKVINAQNAGAVGVLIANNAPVGLPGMGGADGAVVIGSFGISQADGNTLKAELLNGPVNATMKRQAAVNRDGTIDNGIVAHEWGHYISNRLVGNASGLSNLQGGGMGEGWGDFHALMLIMTEGLDYDGAFSAAGYAVGGPAPNDSYYFGLRRYPYSTDLTKNPLTFGHIQDGQPLPVGPPINPNGGPNSEVHNTGEIWASMLWECYAGLLKDTPRLTFAEAEQRMKNYLVAGYKMTPNAPTIIEARDAILAAISVQSPEDLAICAAGFAKRGAGFGAIAPDRGSVDNVGVTESFDATGTALALVETDLNDLPGFCDLDGVLDGGEIGTLSLKMTNVGFAPLNNSQVSVTSPTPGVSFPDGNVAALPASIPFQEVQGSLAIALQPIVGEQVIDLDVTWTDPDQAQPGVANLSFLANFDVIANDSTSDDAESPEPAWNMQLELTAEDAFLWNRLELAPNDHRFHGPDAGGIGITSLISPPLQVSTTDPLIIDFQHRYQFESGGGIDWDGGVVEISTNGGADWTDIGASAATGYTGTITDQASNPFALRNAYIDQSAAYPALEAESIDLGMTYAGQTVLLRFAIGTDEAVGAAGWEIDDIAVSGIDNTPFPSLVGHASLCAAADIQSGDGQTTPVGQAFAQALTVRVLDAQGGGLEDVPVRFEAPVSGASASFTGNVGELEVVTDQNGIASIPAPTANAVSGAYEVLAHYGVQSIPIALGNIPNAPGAPVLRAASDSGRTNSDAITNADPTIFDIACVDADTISLILNAAPVGNSIVCAGGTAAISASLPEGDLAVTARASKAGLDSLLSPTSGVSIDRTAPNAPTIESALPPGELLITVSGNAESEADVEVFDQGASACTTQADLAGAWNCAVTLGGLETRSLTAEQTDAAGNTSALSGAFIVNQGEAIFSDGFED